MNTPSSADPSTKPIAIKIFGVGNAGLNVLEQIAKEPMPGTVLVGVDTDAAALAGSSAAEKIAIEARVPRSHAVDGDAGWEPAEDLVPRFKACCHGAQVVFIVTGLGGGAGTSLSAIVARAAREAGALALAFVTLPFDCEGNRRQKRARQGLEHLKAAADGVIGLPNQKVSRLLDENTSLLETFKRANELLAEGVGGVWRLMAHKGLIEIHFADLCGLLRDRHGESSLAAAEASGAGRSREVLDKLFAHPMLDGGKLLAESEAVLVSLIGGPDLAMSELNRVMEAINRKCEQAQLIMGAAVNESFRDRLAITLVATRRSESLAARAGLDEAAHAEGAQEGLETQLLNRVATTRPHSRFVPPAPVLPPDKVEQILGKQPASTMRGRKTGPKMRQGQLPLEIISKGRFDKSEPTIHKGEDLDVPTYIRRGVPLN